MTRIRESWVKRVPTESGKTLNDVSVEGQEVAVYRGEKIGKSHPTWTAGPVFAVGNGGNAEGW
jgi:hypothetical protein